jgi:hypothetical protein
MARTRIRADQAADTDFVEELELLSDGTISQSGPFSIVSVTSSTKTIVVSSGEFLDSTVAGGDILQISGGTANDGIYTVASVTDQDTIIVVEAVIDAGAAGQAETFFPPADEKVGIQDPGNAYVHTGTYNTLDDHIQDGAVHQKGAGIAHNINELFLVPDQFTRLGSETNILANGEILIEGDGEFLVISI